MSPTKIKTEFVLRGRVSGEGKKWTWSLYLNGAKEDGAGDCESKLEAEDQLCAAAGELTFEDFTANLEAVSV